MIGRADIEVNSYDILIENIQKIIPEIYLRIPKKEEKKVQYF